MAKNWIEALDEEQARLKSRQLGWIRLDDDDRQVGAVRMLPEGERLSLPGRWARAPWLDQPVKQEEEKALC